MPILNIMVHQSGISLNELIRRMTDYCSNISIESILLIGLASFVLLITLWIFFSNKDDKVENPVIAKRKNFANLAEDTFIRIAYLTIFCLALKGVQLTPVMLIMPLLFSRCISDTLTVPFFPRSHWAEIMDLYKTNPTTAKKLVLKAISLLLIIDIGVDLFMYDGAIREIAIACICGSFMTIYSYTLNIIAILRYKIAQVKPDVSSIDSK